MLIAISSYLKPLAEIDIHRPAHSEFLQKSLSLQKILIAGRQVPAHGGVIIAAFASKEEFLAFLADDPYVKNRCAEYHIIEFNPGIWQQTFNTLCEQP